MMIRNCSVAKRQISMDFRLFQVVIPCDTVIPLLERESDT